MMGKLVTARPGSVSWGTLRPQDLIPRFLQKLSDLNSPHYEELILKPIVTSIPWDDEDHPWWDSEDALFLVEDLIDALNDHAPDGYYFGAHPGDGADFGFWEVEGPGME